MTGKAYVRSALAGFALGITMYAGSDVVNDLLTFQILRSQARELADDDKELLEQIGSPLSFGPWYNSSIGFTHRGNIAQCTFQLVGSKQMTDVNVRGIRGPGYASNILYNTLGPRKWDLMVCSAMMPAGGGTVKAKTLLKTPPQPDNAAASGHGMAADGTSLEAMAAAALSMEQAQAATAGCAPGIAGNVEMLKVAVVQNEQQASRAVAAAAAGGKPKRSWWQWLTRQ